MSTMGSIWNAIRYTIYVPIYDLVAGVFSKARKNSINQIKWKGTERVLILGAGSGLDFKYLNHAKEIEAIDIAPGMLAIMKIRAANKPHIKTKLMDGHNLNYPNSHFDVVILHLILAVIPNPTQALLEVERVLKPNGVILVFDKFKPKNKKSSPLRSLINIPATILATSVNRSIETLVEKTVSLEIMDNHSAALNGLFRQIRIEKKISSI